MMDSKELKRVVGLRYEPTEGLPRVIVKGMGQSAEAILESAIKEQKSIVKDRKLVDQLYRLPIDGEIGRELFQLVAIVLAHVFSVDRKTGDIGK